MTERRNTQWVRVTPTPEELAEWRAKHPQRPSPSVYRVQCTRCGKRLWGSGLGIGSHGHSCKPAARR